MNNITEHITAKSEGMQTIAGSRGHQVIIDEKEQMGGRDEGTNPLETLLTSLAGCENIIANMVAEEMKFDLQGIEFDIKGKFDPDGLKGKEGVRPYFQTVIIDAKIKTSESEERIKKLQQTVDARCPLFTTLRAADVEMKTNWTKS